MKTRLNKSVLVCMLLVMVMVLSLFGCAAQDETTTASDTTETSAAVAADDEQAATTEEATTEDEVTFSGTVTIGCALPLTGSVALNGEMIYQGVELAAAQCNAEGGINGKEVVLVKEDDQGEPNQAANIANKFVSDNSILAVIGNLKSSCTLAAAPDL